MLGGEAPFEMLEQHHKKTLNKSRPLNKSQPNLNKSQPNLNLNSSVSKGRTNLNKSQPNLSKPYAQLPSIVNTLNLNTLANNVNNNNTIGQSVFSSGIEYPYSGDESDNHHNQMEHLRSQFYTPDPQKQTKEYHVGQSMHAVELLKALAGSSSGWKKVDKHKSGCIVYQSTDALMPSNGENKFPAFKGEHVIRGYKAQEVFSIVSVRKLWDDWYDELSNVETYDDLTNLIYMVMKGTITSKPRDLAMVERTHVERDGTIYSAACSVDSSKIPRVSGKVRAEVFLAGWVIQPLPSNPPITKITYVIHTDLLSRLPKFMAKRSLTKRAMVIATVETYLKKNGVPAIAAGNAHSRHRSLSEPVKLDRSLLPPDSEDEDESSGSAFLAPLEPIKSKQASHRYDDSAVESTEDEALGSGFLAPLGPIRSKQAVRRYDDSAVDSTEDESTSSRERQIQHQSSRSKGKERVEREPTSSLFSKEFMDDNTFLRDSNLFSDSSLLFGKGSFFDGSQTTPEETPVTAGLARSQTTPAKPPQIQSQQKRQQSPAPEQRKSEKVLEQRRPERAPERSPERSRTVPSNSSRTAIAEPESRKQQQQPQPPPPQPAPKRFSIPVVAPKSEARMMRSFAGSNIGDASGNQLSIPESSLLIMPNTPPLTPPASIMDNTSDSDAAVPVVKVVSRTQKVTPEPVDTSRPSSIAIASSGMASPASATSPTTLTSPSAMKSPSAMMEARRHSALISRTASGFVPRYSNATPIRGNPNVSLQSLTRPSGPNKRHSATPSLSSNQSSTTFAPLMVLPHRHSETARKALAMFKVLASSPEDRWRAISSENGFKSYSRVISGSGLPMLRGEGTIAGGWTVEQINSAIESSGCRQVWDERFENMSIAETFNHNEYLFHVTLRGIGSLTGRDLAGVTIIDRDPLTSALYNVSTSVIDPTIPEDPGRIRAMLELSGWSLRPTFDGQGNTVSVNVTFVIQIDIRGSLPSSVVKSMTSSMTTAVSRLNQFINKSGYPPFASHISGTRLLDSFNPTTGFYELCYKASPGWTEVRIGRKVYKEGYDFFIKPDDPSVRVEMAPDFGGVRVYTTLDHEGQSIIAQVSRKGQNAVEREPTEEEEERLEEAEQAAALSSSSQIKESSRQSDIDTDMRHSTPSSRKRRSASYAIPQTNDLSASPSRPESQASVFSKASHGSERSRSRGRAPRSIVTVPAGAPPPPLPRRSSSLTRYSIPISPYLAPVDAPPLPANTSATIASATESSTPIKLAATSPKSTTPSDSPLGSPTLGVFHIPHTLAPVSTGATDAPSSPRDSKRISAILSVPISPMESISNVLSDSMTTVKEESVAAVVVPAETEGSTTIDAAMASETEVVSVVSIVEKSLASPSSPKEIEKVSMLLSSQASPTSTPVPSPMAAVFGPRESSLPLSTSTVTVVTPATTILSSTSLLQPASQPKSRGSGITRRVTFSLDTIDKSSSDSPLDSLMNLGDKNKNKINNDNDNKDNDNNNKSTDTIVVKEHSVQLMPAPQVLQQRHAIVESNTGYESDEAEFVEARDELTVDEAELLLVLASVGSWPWLKSSTATASAVASRLATKGEERGPAVEMVGSTLKMVGTGVRLVSETPVEFKAAIVFMLLVYYAGRLASLIA